VSLGRGAKAARAKEKHMKFSKRNRIRYGQDFFQHVGLPSGVDFDVTIDDANCATLRAPGYGGTPYGNGAIHVRRSMNKNSKTIGRLFANATQ